MYKANTNLQDHAAVCRQWVVDYMTAHKAISQTRMADIIGVAPAGITARLKPVGTAGCGVFSAQNIADLIVGLDMDAHWQAKLKQRLMEPFNRYAQQAMEASTVGEFIKLRADALGMSQADVARAAHLDDNSEVAKLYNNKRPLNREQARSLTSVLQLNELEVGVLNALSHAQWHRSFAGLKGAPMDAIPTFPHERCLRAMGAPSTLIEAGCVHVGSAQSSGHEQQL